MKKTLSYSLMLCLVCLVASACSPASSPDRGMNTTNATEKNGQIINYRYNNPSGPYDDDLGYKSDFQPSDLNPNMVTGQNDLYNIHRDVKTLAQMARHVRGVDNARATINGGRATVRITVNGTERDVEKVRALVYQKLKQKMPRYNINVVSE
ncbi:hypothetical protein [Ammoniphilus resinae]|uniref:Sporulation protein n=1 Tax=Ammoniphilus resinae TaxID=861532 RepID=A0ABS4GUR8_9BACL|nr:hypothetical protein [Ammoniphilus resinae]MBP1934005.1 hypothetical protein [Ammoniphilus resinae]